MQRNKQPDICFQCVSDRQIDRKTEYLAIFPAKILRLRRAAWAGVQKVRNEENSTSVAQRFSEANLCGLGLQIRFGGIRRLYNASLVNYYRPVTWELNCLVRCSQPAQATFSHRGKIAVAAVLLGNPSEVLEPPTPAFSVCGYPARSTTCRSRTAA